MQVLALEPYFGGSHRAFLDGWLEHSHHQFQVLSLPAHQWKWRMRHAAITFADRLAEQLAKGNAPAAKVIFCSDMLALAEFRGLAPRQFARLPAILYFHENQLTYPVREVQERDHHFAMTNITSALAADQVWFNSGFHREEFLAAARKFLARMPDYQLLGAVDAIAHKSSVHPPAVAPLSWRGARKDGPLRILWAARWEHDKDPETFFAALQQLEQRGVPFRVSVLGQSFAKTPRVFAEAKARLAGRIDNWGYLENRDAYAAVLSQADVFVSTAQHEFFGIAAVEAIAAGAFPLLPQRLAYPELLPEIDPARASFFYEGDAEPLANGLQQAAERLAAEDLWQGNSKRASRQVSRFTWERVVGSMDEQLVRLVEAARS